jgi:ABC-type transporter Mla maintaining outer membrane lipid asymmetry permease subunit MlaE
VWLSSTSVVAGMPKMPVLCLCQKVTCIQSSYASSFKWTLMSPHAFVRSMAEGMRSIANMRLPPEELWTAACMHACTHACMDSHPGCQQEVGTYCTSTVRKHCIALAKPIQALQASCLCATSSAKLA